MDGFSHERARRERLATGETVRKPPLTPHSTFTPGAQIASWPGTAHHQEIAVRCFIIPHTVECTWATVFSFTKLGITSRKTSLTHRPIRRQGQARAHPGSARLPRGSGNGPLAHGQPHIDRYS